MSIFGTDSNKERYANRDIPHINRLIEQLKGIKMDYLLLSDFVIKPEYVVKQKDIFNRNILERSLNLITLSIFSRLKLPPFYSLEIIYEGLDSNVRIGGMYTKNGYNNIIKIVVKKQSTFETLTAALCHECVHYFVDYNHFREPDFDNEIKTDVLTNLIGFNKICIKGYGYVYYTESGTGAQKKVITYKKKPWYIKVNSKGQIRSNPAWTGQTHKSGRVGYLTVKECQLIGQYLNDYRRQHQGDEYTSASINKAKEELRNEIQLAKDLYGRLEMIDPRRIPNENIKSARQVQRLNQAIIEYDSFDLEKTLEKHISNTESDNITVIRSSIQEVKKINTKILGWSNSFQGIE